MIFPNNTSAPQLIDELPFFAASTRSKPEFRTLPISAYHGPILKTKAQGILFTSDLQGAASAPSRKGASVLLGEALVEKLKDLADEGRIPPLSSLGAVLAGDLFSDLEARHRGATGNVDSVWRAFRKNFAWLVGVAGNHDTFRNDPPQGLLDGDSIDIDGLRFAGVSYIASTRSKKVGHRSEGEQLQRLQRALACKPDVLVLHQGPEDEAHRRKGEPGINKLLEKGTEALVAFGHCPWPEPFCEGKGWRGLNLDGRCVLLLRDHLPKLSSQSSLYYENQ